MVGAGTEQTTNCYKNPQLALLPLQGHSENVWGCFQLPQYLEVATGIEWVG